MFTERLAQARESLTEAKLLHEQRIGNRTVMVKLYHTMIYGLFALMRIDQIGNLTHADIIREFEKIYVQEGSFDPQLLSVLRRAYDLVHVCGCKSPRLPEDTEVEGAIPVVEEFIERVAQYSAS